MRRRVLVALLLALGAGCAEEQAPGITPITSASPRTAPVAEEPSPLIVQPHVRRTEHAEAPRERQPIGGGGGGGGGGGRSDVDWTPEPRRPPTQRELDQFLDRFGPEVEGQVDPAGDPCEELGDAARAALEATDSPRTQDPSVPSDRRLRERCNRFPETFRQCMSPEYAREHQAECDEEMARMSARTERQAEQARRQYEAMRSGARPWPAPPERPARRDEPEDG